MQLFIPLKTSISGCTSRSRSIVNYEALKLAANFSVMDENLLSSLPAVSGVVICEWANICSPSFTRPWTRWKRLDEDHWTTALCWWGPLFRALHFSRSSDAVYMKKVWNLRASRCTSQASLNPPKTLLFGIFQPTKAFNSRVPKDFSYV